MVPFHSELFFSLQASSADCMASDEQTDRQTESQAICPTIWSVCACAKRVRRRKKRRVFSVWSSEAVVVAATEARRLDLQATLQQSNSVTVWTADYCLSLTYWHGRQWCHSVQARGSESSGREPEPRTSQLNRTRLTALHPKFKSDLKVPNCGQQQTWHFDRDSRCCSADTALRHWPTKKWGHQTVWAGRLAAAIADIIEWTKTRDETDEEWTTNVVAWRAKGWSELAAPMGLQVALSGTLIGNGIPLHPHLDHHHHHQQLSAWLELIRNGRPSGTAQEARRTCALLYTSPDRQTESD